MKADKPLGGVAAPDTKFAMGKASVDMKNNCLVFSIAFIRYDRSDRALGTQHSMDG